MNKAAAAAAKSLQSYPTLCDPIDGSPPGSPIPGILQAGTLEWVGIAFSGSLPIQWHIDYFELKLFEKRPVECKLYLKEGNGNPLQYSCLENPMDGGAW